MASAPVQVRIPPITLAAVDEARGDESRSAWILGAIGLRLSPVAAAVAELSAPAVDVGPVIPVTVLAPSVRGETCAHPKARVFKGLCHACGRGGLG